MKIQHLLISSCIALSATAFAEPPKDEQAANAKQKSETIEIAVEKIERADKKLKAPQDTDLDGDGYGDAATKAAESHAKAKAKAKEKEKAKCRVDEDCDDN